jgi:hypothetical protein
MRWQWQGKIDGILNFFRLLPFGISALSDFVITLGFNRPLAHVLLLLPYAYQLWCAHFRR